MLALPQLGGDVLVELSQLGGNAAQLAEKTRPRRPWPGRRRATASAASPRAS